MFDTTRRKFLQYSSGVILSSFIPFKIKKKIKSPFEIIYIEDEAEIQSSIGKLEIQHCWLSKDTNGEKQFKYEDSYCFRVKLPESYQLLYETGFITREFMFGFKRYDHEIIRSVHSCKNTGEFWDKIPWKVYFDKKKTNLKKAVHIAVINKKFNNIYVFSAIKKD